MGVRFWPSGARPSCLEVLSAACLGLHFGQRADAQVSRCTVFYDRICSSITFGVHVLHSWQMLRQVEIVKTRAGIHFLYTQHMRNIPDVALLGMFRYDFRLARTIWFRTEKRIGSFIVKQKFVCEHVDHSKNCHAWYLLFCYRKCCRTIWFQREIVFQARIFCPKTNDATTFYVQNRWCRCHGPIGA